jgi:hypothetical protein
MRTVSHNYKNGGDDSKKPTVVVRDNGIVEVISDGDCDADGSKRATTIDPSCGQGGTSLSKPTWRGANQYVDSESIPFYVLPMNWSSITQLDCKLGDIAKVTYKGKSIFTILADRGPNDKLGELSICAIEKLGGNPWNSSRTRIVSGLPHGVIYEIKPNSANLARTVDYASIQQYGNELFTGEKPMPESNPLEMPKIDITQYDSPNFSERTAPISGIVIHNTDCSFQVAINTFMSSSSKVSAHLIIARDGRVACLVPFSKKAWHAMQANSGTIGIEMEADSGHKGLTPEQNLKLVKWVKWMMAHYGIQKDKIITHRTVVNTDCPKWIFPTEADFVKWKANNL